MITVKGAQSTVRVLLNKSGKYIDAPPERCLQRLMALSLSRSLLKLSFALMMVCVLQSLQGQTPTSSEAAPDAFIFEAKGGYYDRHRIQIPPNAIGVRVKIVIIESYEDTHWGAATGLGLGIKKVADPDDTKVFSRISFNEKIGATQIKLTTSTKNEKIVAKTNLKPGTILIWEADWNANRLILSLNKQIFLNDVRDFPPEVLQLSVSGMKLNVEDITFIIP